MLRSLTSLPPSVSLSLSPAAEASVMAALLPSLGFHLRTLGEDSGAAQGRRLQHVRRLERLAGTQLFQTPHGTHLQMATWAGPDSPG